MDRRAFLATVGAATALAGCSTGGETGESGDDGGGAETTSRIGGATISFDVAGVEADHPLPVKYTCDGENVSPKVTLVEAADRIESFALVVSDPTADDFVHWTVWGVNPELPDIPEAIPGDPTVTLSEITPQGDGDATIIQGTNDFGDVGYGGPCPPEGERHNYHFTLYGLESAADLEPGVAPSAVQSAIDELAIGDATVSTHYERGGE